MYSFCLQSVLFDMQILCSSVSCQIIRNLRSVSSLLLYVLNFRLHYNGSLIFYTANIFKSTQYSKVHLRNIFWLVRAMLRFTRICDNGNCAVFNRMFLQHCIITQLLVPPIRVNWPIKTLIKGSWKGNSAPPSPAYRTITVTCQKFLEAVQSFRFYL
jgi:hypothetical protein